MSYVHTTAAVKALTGIVITSSKVKQIVDSIPCNEKIIFGLDRIFRNYINLCNRKEYDTLGRCM